MDGQTAKLIARIAENLPAMEPDEMQGWIDSPKALQNALRKVFGRPFVPGVFITIKLGTGLKTADDFVSALAENGCEACNWAKNIFGMPQFTVAGKETEVDLVVVSVAELGFKRSATREDIYRRAIELGLELCPPEVGPQLRLQYKDQPEEECLFVAMEPISGLGERPVVFCVAQEFDGPVLSCSQVCSDVFPGFLWDATNRWVFLLRK